MKRSIIISGINLIDGGTFTIIKECLDAIEKSLLSVEYKVIAIVHKKELFPIYQNIEFLEFPKSKHNYLLRFYYEYYKFKRISEKYKPLLWLSLHDMSPIVKTEIQAVYMHNPSPFLGPPKSLSFRGIGFSYLYKYIYKINIHSNDYLIVQQNWLRESFSKMFNFSEDKIIVARPFTQSTITFQGQKTPKSDSSKVFVYASYPRGFKNFELICESAQLLENKGVNNFVVRLTIDGSENDYSKSIVKRYSNVKSIEFLGLQPREVMETFYSDSDCLIFPSKAETWGLPISEYSILGKPMILADLPYAHETAGGARFVSFVGIDDVEQLAKRMLDIINNELDSFKEVPVIPLNAPVTNTWEELFDYLINNKKNFE